MQGGAVSRPLHRLLALGAQFHETSDSGEIFSLITFPYDPSVSRQLHMQSERHRSLKDVPPTPPAL